MASGSVMPTSMALSTSSSAPLQVHLLYTRPFQIGPELLAKRLVEIPQYLGDLIQRFELAHGENAETPKPVSILEGQHVYHRLAILRRLAVRCRRLSGDSVDGESPKGVGHGCSIIGPARFGVRRGACRSAAGPCKGRGIASPTAARSHHCTFGVFAAATSAWRLGAAEQPLADAIAHRPQPCVADRLPIDGGHAGSACPMM